jgi:hypothetical protein
MTKIRKANFAIIELDDRKPEEAFVSVENEFTALFTLSFKLERTPDVPETFDCIGLFIITIIKNNETKIYNTKTKIRTI